MDKLLTLIVPVKDGASALHLRHPRVDLIEIHGPLESISRAFFETIRDKVETPWAILGNDDITISPQNPPHAEGFSHYPDNDWVSILEDEIRHLNDPYWMLHPDDGCFGSSVSIFPILNVAVVKANPELFPAFKRYCLDPHLHAIFKLIGRVKYVPTVLFDHQNFYTDQNIPEWALGVCYGKNGRRYCVKPGPACDHDHVLAQQQPTRAIAQKLIRQIQQHAEQAAGPIDVRPRPVMASELATLGGA